LDPALIAAVFGIDKANNHLENNDKYKPSHNVAPGKFTPVLTLAGKKNGGDNKSQVPLAVDAMKWGLVPRSCKTPDLYPRKAHLARAETLLSKKNFKKLVQGQRCVILANGFFEFRKVKVGKKQGGDGSTTRVPYLFHFASNNSNEKDGVKKEEKQVQDEIEKQWPILTMAGLYDTCVTEEGETIHTYTIITVPMLSDADFVHDRMPAILSSQDEVNAWLNGSLEVSEAMKLLRSYDLDNLEWHPVSTFVALMSNDGPKCVREDRSLLPPGDSQPSRSTLKIKRKFKLGLKKEESNADDKMEVVSKGTKRATRNHNNGVKDEEEEEEEEEEVEEDESLVRRKPKSKRTRVL